MLKSITPESAIKDASLKVTPLRLFIIDLLSGAAHPMTVSQIKKKAKGLGDVASVYRSLNIFCEKNIVRKLTLMKNKASYELVTKKNHMHHVVCDNCHIVEPISFCMKNINKNAFLKTKLFKSILDHNVSFSGTCKKCARAIR